MAQITIKIQETKLPQREPAVLVPLESWKKIEDLLEDAEAARSKTLRRRVARARQEKAQGLVVPFEKLR